MAYGNWGGTVYKDGIKQVERSDNTPYRENELIAGYWQAFVKPDKKFFPCHITMGNGPLRLCGYKDIPILYWEGEEMPLHIYDLSGKNFSESEWDWWESEGIAGEIEEYKFKVLRGENSATFELIEPDGTLWVGECGYGIGCGYEW